LSVPVLRRRIPGTDLHDGILSWPYVLADPGELAASLEQDGSGLVSVTGTVLSTNPPPPDGSFVARDAHYAFDPASGPIRYSPRTRAHIARGQRAHGDVMWSALASDVEVHALYQDAVRRYTLTGGFFDFPVEHFSFFAGRPGAEVVVIPGRDGPAAMACLLQSDGDTHVIHFVVGDTGLRTDAGPVLAAALIERATQRGSRVFFAGVPAAGRPGLATFKARFTNTRVPVWLARIVLDVDTYQALSAQGETSYFPAYRDPVAHQPLTAPRD
jgi:hypothetical protein